MVERSHGGHLLWRLWGGEGVLLVPDVSGLDVVCWLTQLDSWHPGGRPLQSSQVHSSEQRWWKLQRPSHELNGQRLQWFLFTILLDMSKRVETWRPCEDIGDYLPGWTGPLPPVAYDFPPLYPAPEVPYTGYQAPLKLM